MNGWNIYKAPPEDLDDTSSVVYVIEYPESVKIGRTKHPRSRLRTHQNNALKSQRAIGRVAIKYVNDNYWRAERELLQRFADMRIENTEEFLIKFEDVINCMSEEKNHTKISELELLREENKRLSEELKFAKKIAEALGFDWTKFYEDEKNGQ
jgi:hypothetical protein